MTAPDPRAVIHALDALEVEALALRIECWHLIVWPRSPVRPLVARFSKVYSLARSLIDGYRQRRADLVTAAQTMGHHQVLPGQLAILADGEMALLSRVERVRFLITSKEGEEHAKRSVLLGVLGAVLGALSLILGVASLRR